MELRRGHLRYFVTVADEASITRAAAKLHISQPTLSQAISLLESDLGLALLERHGRGVKLTPDGDVFLVKARAAVSAWADAFAVGEPYRNMRANATVFGFLGVPPGLDSPLPLQRFLRAHPDWDLRYLELPFPTRETSVWLGEADVAVCHRPPPDAEVWRHPLRSERRVALVSSAHPLAARDELGVADLLEETFIGFHRSVDPDWAGFWSLDDHRGAPPRRVTADAAANPQEVMAALALRHAITTVPASVARLLAGPAVRLAAIPVADALPAQLELFGRKDTHNPRVAALLAFARGGR
ncbi:MAG TPA: LysR family transcriptional regulator [Solirubrobacteraceae bacterium]|jgi:DNA-binding transcriptional LysR family regulator|nr:LysR family transcriptional regulator [Solirubrobacteraceae bacterium]